MSKQNIKTSFPDKEFLEELVRHQKEKAEKAQSLEEQLLTYSSVRMNWIADYILDPTIQWNKEELNVDELYLTGTNPEWNAVIIDRCKRSPKKFRELILDDKNVILMFREARFENKPILARYEEKKYKVLDGMKRVIAAIRDGHPKITAFIARPQGKPQPKCEPHVVYDLLRAYHRGLNQDKDSLITALRFLRHSYSNVDFLLKERFKKSWLPSDEIQEIIKEALKG